MLPRLCNESHAISVLLVGGGGGFGRGGGLGGGPGGFGMLAWVRLGAVARETIACRTLFSCGISLAALSNGSSGSSVGLAPVCSTSLFGAAIKVRALLNG